jgi:riboflavin kinase/FMN adenylyltransferase
MKIWKTLEQANQDMNALNAFSAITIGNFDGVHRGHQVIIGRTLELAKSLSGQAIVVSFSNHTDNVLGDQPPLLNQPEIRTGLLSGLNVDGLLMVDFNREFAALTPEMFFEKWLVEGLKVRAIVVGYDFKFGAEGRGNYQLLQELCNAKSIIHEQMEAVTEDGHIISSSKIRQLIMDGKIELANKMLGYHFEIAGTVVHGEQRGRRMGFPTANIQLGPQYLLPAYGVYLVEFFVNGKAFFGIANVGKKPTFGSYAPLIEVHILDNHLDLYQKEARVRFLKFIRPETQFVNVETLKKQIAKDIEMARIYIQETEVLHKSFEANLN